MGGIGNAWPMARRCIVQQYNDKLFESLLDDLGSPPPLQFTPLVQVSHPHGGSQPGVLGCWCRPRLCDGAAPRQRASGGGAPEGWGPHMTHITIWHRLCLYM